jgi:hypothetical protein
MADLADARGAADQARPLYEHSALSYQQLADEAKAQGRSEVAQQLEERSMKIRQRLVDDRGAEPRGHAEQPHRQLGDVLVSGPFPLTEEMFNEFRLFCEWILEVDFPEEHENSLRDMLIRDWSQNDKDTMDSVTACIRDFQDIKEADEPRRNSCRDQSQPAFVALLRNAAPADPIAAFLLEAYEAANPRLATNNVLQRNPGEGLGGLLATLGGAARSALTKGGNKSVLGALGGAALSALTKRGNVPVDQQLQPQQMQYLQQIPDPHLRIQEYQRLLQEQQLQNQGYYQPTIGAGNSPELASGPVNPVNSMFNDMLQEQRREEEKQAAANPNPTEAERLKRQSDHQNDQMQNMLLMQEMARISSDMSNAISRNISY